MLNRVDARLSSLALLIAAVAFGFTACDSGGGGGGANPGTFNDGTADTLDIASMSPDDGADVDSRAPTLTVTFTESIVENEYTNAGTPQQDSETGDQQGSTDRSENRGLIDGVRLTSETAKSVTPSGSIPVDIEWTNGRASLAVTVDTSDEDFEGLQDGYIYELSLGDRSNETGVYDKRFKSTSGSLFRDLDGDGDAETGNVNPVLNPQDLQFSVGINEEAPAVPTVTFNPDDENVADPTTLADGVYDYTDGSITAPLQVDGIDNNPVEVKGYEVYYRSQNELGRNGIGDQYVKATDGDISIGRTPLTQFADKFEDSEGIIPASAVDDGEFDDRDLEFTVTLGNNPFEAADGTYGPIEWKFRAVSINGVRSDFTDPITTPDNTGLDVTSAEVTETDGSGNIEVIEVGFDEPLTTGTVDATDFNFEDSGSDLDIGVSVTDNGSGDQTGDTVVLDITENEDGRENLETDDTLVASDLEDLAGNGLEDDDVSVTDP